MLFEVTGGLKFRQETTENIGVGFRLFSAVPNDIWLVSFMNYDFGYLDLDSGPRTTRSSIRPKSVTHVAGTLCNPCVRVGH